MIVPLNITVVVPTATVTTKELRKDMKIYGMNLLVSAGGTADAQIMEGEELISSVFHCNVGMYKSKDVNPFWILVKKPTIRCYQTSGSNSTFKIILYVEQ